MPRNMSFALNTYFGFVFLMIVLKVYSVFSSLWKMVLRKYRVLISIAYLPITWAVIVPACVLSIYLLYNLYVLYLSMESRARRNIENSISEGSNNSHLLMVESNQDRDCICIDKNLCYKKYYDDAHIECVSKSLPKVIHINGWNI